MKKGILKGWGASQSNADKIVYAPPLIQSDEEQISLTTSQGADYFIRYNSSTLRLYLIGETSRETSLGETSPTISRKNK